MSELDLYREKINDIDARMAALFEERMEQSRLVAEYKKKNGLPIRNGNVEAEKIARQKEMITSDAVRPYYVLFQQKVMDISRDYQSMLLEGMTIAYGGVEGAYAQIAAHRLFPQGRLVSNVNFAQAYRSVEKGEADCAVLPIENSIAGEVGAVLDLMYQGSLHINQIYSLPIRHRLMGLPGSSKEKIVKVYSHSQALHQCNSYLEKNHFIAEKAATTSDAAQRVLDLNDPTVGAIASEETAELMGLEILDADIQNDDSNTTRFAVFSRSLDTPASGKRRTDENFILVFTVRNEAGALASTLNIIGAHGYNMRNLRSRPLKSLPWHYYFYLEAEGDIHTQNGKDMMRELSVLCADLKLVGTFREEHR